MTNSVAVIEIAQANKESFRDGFIDWLTANTHVYFEFDRLALQVSGKRDHYSGYTLFEVIRHHSLLRDKSSEWKINNNHCADCCRLFMLCHPELGNFFELRGRARLAA